LIDREQLQQAFRRIRNASYQLLAAPLLLGVFGWWFSRETATSAAAAGSGDVPMPLLITTGILVLSPLLLVPLGRAALLRFFLQPDHPNSAGRRQALIPLETYMSCMLWAFAIVPGFVPLFVGGVWWLYIAAVAITYGGLFIHFPRWSRWLERAEQLDLAAAQLPVASPL
jgi:hypothetical protein